MAMRKKDRLALALRLMMDETMRHSWKSQRVYSRRIILFLALVLLLLVLQSCGTQDVDNVRWDATSLYLEEVVPPCVPLWDSSHDPCPVEVPPIVDVHSIAGSSRRWPSQGFTWTEILLGHYTFTLATHLVVRGEAKFDTTRCETYPLRLESFWYDMFPDVNLYFMENSGPYHHCYIDIGVKEYIVGSGPPVLTVSMHRESLGWGLDFNDWPDVEKDRYIKEFLDDPQSRVATAYEGKELILFLNISSTIAVESFEVMGPIADLWFVQKDGDEIRAVAQDIRYATEERRSRLDLPLDDLTEQLKKAATERASITDGRIGSAPYPLPLLVTDANHLRDYFISVGAVYDDSDEATVLPPPVPGEVPPTDDDGLMVDAGLAGDG